MIVDDVAYFEEPFFQDGPVAVAVDEVVAAGVSYFSAAGNDNLIDAGGRRHRLLGSAGIPRRASGCPPALEAGDAGRAALHCDFDPAAATTTPSASPSTPRRDADGRPAVGGALERGRRPTSTPTCSTPTGTPIVEDGGTGDRRDHAETGRDPPVGKRQPAAQRAARRASAEYDGGRRRESCNRDQRSAARPDSSSPCCRTAAA